VPPLTQSPRSPQRKKERRSLAETCFRLACVQVQEIDVDVDECDEIMRELYDVARKEGGFTDLFRSIDETRDIDEEDAAELVRWIREQMSLLDVLDAEFGRVAQEEANAKG
jgi:hypothetical protein